jgi:hypothetical protein
MRFEKRNEIRIRSHIIDIPDVRLFKKLLQKAGNSTTPQKKDGFRLRMLKEGQVGTDSNCPILEDCDKQIEGGISAYSPLFKVNIRISLLIYVSGHTLLYHESLDYLIQY